MTLYGVSIFREGKDPSIVVVKCVSVEELKNTVEWAVTILNAKVITIVGVEDG